MLANDDTSFNKEVTTVTETYKFRKKKRNRYRYIVSIFFFIIGKSSFSYITPYGYR